MKEYKTGYFISNSEITNKKLPKGKYFNFGLLKNDKRPREKEILIKTNNLENARKVHQLLAATMTLLYGQTFIPFDSLAIPIPISNGLEKTPIQPSKNY